MKHAIAALVILGGLAAQPTLAAPSASIDWTTFSVQLFDTDPTDGVAPSLTWLSQSSQTWAYIDYNWNWNDQEGVPDWTSELQFLRGSSEASVNESEISVSIAGGSDYNSAGAYRWGMFELSQNTIAVFSVNGGFSGASFDTGRHASVSLDVYNSGLLGRPYGNSSSTLTNWDGYTYHPSTSGTLSVAFVNMTDTIQEAYVQGSVQASIQPVPEPESYAMLLAGLGLIGAIARRRHT